MGVLGMDMIALLNAMLWPSFFCHFGNLAADHVSAISHVAYDLNWFEHPVDVQKFMILIIARSNKRAEFLGLHLIPCSMETFGKVIHFTAIHCQIYGFRFISFQRSNFSFSICRSSNRRAHIISFSESYHSVKNSHFANVDAQ